VLIAAHNESVWYSGGTPPHIDLVSSLRKAVSLNVVAAVITGEVPKLPAGKEGVGCGTFLRSVYSAQLQWVM